MKYTLEGTADKSFKLYYSIQDNRCGPAKVGFSELTCQNNLLLLDNNISTCKNVRVFNTITLNLIQPAVLSSLAESESIVNAVHEETSSCRRA